MKIAEYKEVNGEMQLVTRKMTAEEIEELESLQANEETPQPTAQDRLEAQVLYTALMTNTLIEEG